MAKKWTLAELQVMPVHDRAELYRNACRLAHTDEGAALKARIEEAGLPFSEEACLSMDDPITIKMWEIINSPEGRKAAVESVQVGEPAMLRIDPLLSAALGSDYGAHNMGTATAGSLVAQLMLSLGYKKAGPKKLPTSCVAQRAATWV